MRSSEHLNKLTIAQLKQLTIVPKNLKKKQEIIDFILNKENNSSESSSSIKRIKIAPVFAMSIQPSADPQCTLCDDTKSVWCELGLALCPLCTIPPSPSVEILPLKHEPGVTSLRYTNDVEGRIVLDIGSVDKEELKGLVAVHGFGLCESAEALGLHGTLEKAAEALLNKHRSSAENSSIAEAQLNSEHARDETAVSNVEKLRYARSAVLSDISVLTEIDGAFSAKYIFPDNPLDEGQILCWLVENESNPLLMFDYLVLRRDSMKWYKNHAVEYFNKTEIEILSLKREELSNWFVAHNGRLKDALYTLPETGGSIPVIFRSEDFNAPNLEDVEVLVIGSDGILIPDSSDIVNLE